MLVVKNERQPTIKEAVEWIKKAHTREYRAACIEYWREKYGENYAESIVNQVKTQWKKANKLAWKY